MLLDRIGCPAIGVWGSVYASSDDGRSFSLNALGPRLSPMHSPGHSWLLTPYSTVLDLTLFFQDGVAGDYESLRGEITLPIVSSERSSIVPEAEWWALGTQLPAIKRIEDETLYLNVLGWNPVQCGSLLIRYLPGAVNLPSEVDPNDAKVRIGGLAPGDFFEEACLDLVGEQ